MPPLPSEVVLLIDNLTKQIQHNADLQETQRQFTQNQIDGINALIKQIEANGGDYVRSYVEERLKYMEKEINELKKQLEDVKEAILEKQEERYKMMIRIQTSIILLVVGAILTILTKVIFNV